MEPAPPAKLGALVVAAVKALPEPAEWALLIDRTGFSRPADWGVARERLLHCAAVFRVNYCYVVAACAAAALLCDVGALLFALAGGAAAAALLADTRVVGVSVFKGITPQQRQAGAVGVCAAALVLGGAAGAAAGGAVAGAAACAAHGACYEPAPTFV